MAMDKQMELFEPVTRGFDEGGLMQEGGTVDPVSGNEVPTGSTQEEVRDDIPAQLSEGEFVMPADVVRYHGLDKMMALRDEAKMGLARMEAMGQMGNADEATIPDGVPFDASNLPFDINDLDLEEDTSEYQVGGFVPAPQVQLPGVSYQQSQFAGYQPQYQQYQQPQVPQQPQTPQYQAPQQQFTPTVTGQAPSFGALVQPTTATYYDKDGNTLQIPVDANGNPLIPIPPGFSKTKPQTAAQAASSAGTGTGTGAPQTFTSEGGDSVTTAPPKSAYEQEQDAIKADPRFKDILEEFDKRTGIEKAVDVVSGLSPVGALLGGGTRGKEYAQLRDELAANIQAIPEDQREEFYKELALATEQVKQGRTPEEGLANVIDMTTPEAREKLKAEGKLTTSPEQVRDITKTATKAKDITDMQAEYEKAAGLSSPRVETAQTRREGEAAGAATKADIKYENLTDAQKEMIDDVAPKSYSEEAAKMLGVEYDERLEGKELTPVEQSIIQDRVTQDMMGSQDEPTRTSAALSGADDRRQAEQIIQERAAERAAQTASAKTAGELRSAYPSRGESMQARYDEQASKYESQGYSRSAAAVAGRNKVQADDEAKTQTGNPNASAVTSSDGKAVRSASSNNVVVSASSVADDGGGDDSGGKIVCTEMYRQTQLDDWKQAIKIWGTYEKKYLTKYHEIGYHWLFKPYVRGMQNSNMLTQIGAYLAQERTKHLKHIMTKGRAKDSLVGNIWCKFIHPIVYVAGRIKNG